MTTVRLGMEVPARWRAFGCGLCLFASCVLAATANAWVPNLSALPPGQYPYELDVLDHPAHAGTLTIAADTSWEITVGRDGEVWSPLQLY